jgi:hypothetical protein
MDVLSRQQTPWLLVFDYYNKPGDFPTVSSFFPQSSTGAVLFTSRHADSERLGAAVHLTGMTEDEALELLLTQAKVEQREENAATGKSIVQRLGYLPLAIDQAGAYISVRRLRLAHFPKHFDEQWEAVMKHTPMLWEYGRRQEQTKDTDTRLSVFTTWDMSFQQVGADDAERESIHHFLSLATYYDNTQIDEKIFKNYHDSTSASPRWLGCFATGASWDRYKFQTEVVKLLRLSFVQNVDVCGDHTTFSLNHLVADWIRLRLGASRRGAYFLEAIAALKCHVD